MAFSLDRHRTTTLVAGAFAGAVGLLVFRLLPGFPGAVAAGATVLALLGAASWALKREASKRGAAEPAPASAELLGTLSHEIRTPLNGILGLTQLLLGLRPTAQQREYLEMLKSSGEALVRLINDLLDYSRFQAGKLRLEREALHLRRIVRHTVKTLSPQAHLKGLEIGYWIEGDVPEIVEGDPGRLRQVLANLVVNATKFTDRGEILVRVSRVGAAEGTRVRFEVRDTGIGIPEDGREAIFEAFAQGPAATTRAQGGLGLGLAISSRIVERMGGKLSVASELGQGSTFAFDVPFEIVEERGDGDGQPPEAFQGARVLLVEDSPMQRGILVAQLSEWGCSVEAVADADAALQAVERSIQLARPFSLLLLDSGLPGADSWLLAKRIQAHSRIPGILLTFTHEYVDPEALRAHGFLGHLSKPVAPSHLSRAIEIIRRGACVEKPEDVQTHSMDRLLLAGLRVLLAEDHPVNRTVVVRSLENAGSEVVAVEDGERALELAGVERFDLLLLDLSMPQKDGYEVVREIRRRERSTGRHLPVVAITAHARDEDRKRCLQMGMDGFLVKPLDESALFDTIGRLVRPGRPRPIPETASPAVFDEKRALLRATGDRALVVELSELFLEDAPRTVGAIARRLAAGEFETVEREVHRLKGALLTLAADSAAEAALDLETVAKTADAGGCQAAFDRLQEELRRLQETLSSQLDVRTL